jgi:hypothetical protein
VKFYCYLCGKVIYGEGEACAKCVMRGAVGTADRAQDTVTQSIVWGVAISATILVGLLLLMI